MPDELLGRTLEELEGEDWGEPNYETYVVVNCHRLRRVPLGAFTTEDLRLMIGQSIGLAYLMPLALQYLYANPLAEGNHYPGDLLQAVLRNRTKAFWQEHPEWYAAVSDLVANLLEALEEIKPDIAQFHGVMLE